MFAANMSFYISSIQAKGAAVPGKEGFRPQGKWIIFRICNRATLRALALQPHWPGWSPVALSFIELGFPKSAPWRTAAQLSFDIEPRTDGESGQSVSYSNPTFDKRCVRVVIAKSDEWLLETSGCVGGHKKALSKSTCDLQHNPSINIH